jgi:hypothetical protein
MYNDRDAHSYRLAQANKLIRLGAVDSDSADVVLGVGPVVPDPVDFAQTATNQMSNLREVLTETYSRRREYPR